MRDMAADAIREAAAFGRSIGARAGLKARGQGTEESVAGPRDPGTGGDVPRARAAAVTAGKRWLAVLALFTAACAVLALVVASLGGSGEGVKLPATHRQPPKHTASSTAGGGTGERARVNSAAGRPVDRPPPTPVSEALAAQLEARGHDLLESGS
jgi:hypothetical protein